MRHLRDKGLALSFLFLFILFWIVLFLDFRSGTKDQSHGLYLLTGFGIVMGIAFTALVIRDNQKAAGHRPAPQHAQASPAMGPDPDKAYQALTTGLSSLPQKLKTIEGTARENQDQANAIFSSAEIVHGNIRRVSEFMAQASENLITISEAAEGITGTIDEIAGNSENAKTVTQEAVIQTRSTREKVAELGEAASQIESVTHTINEISEQTNLLALNATIEAARAGEAGRGFAVVANEVKALARQTAEATEDIRNKAAHINAITAQTVDQIEQISQIIHNGNEMVISIALAVDNQSASTREIAETVGQASQGISEVSGKVSANLEFVSGILDRIRAVETQSGELARETGQVIQFSRDQIAAAQGLENLLSPKGKQS